MMRDRQIAWVPTFAPVQMQMDHADRMAWDAMVGANLKRMLDQHAHSARTAHASGVRLIAGSDAASYGVAHGLAWRAPHSRFADGMTANFRGCLSKARQDRAPRLKSLGAMRGPKASRAAGKRRIASQPWIDSCCHNRRTSVLGER